MLETIIAAYKLADKAYEDAITTKIQMDEALRSVPVGDEKLYQRVIAVYEECVHAVNAAWYAKDAINKLMMDLPKKEK